MGYSCFLSPWFFAYAQGVSKADAWVNGLAIALISITAILAFSKWEEWLVLLLGLWLMLAPWILGITHAAAYVSIGVGIAITYIALLDIWCIHYSIDTPPTESNEFTGDR